jgi:hypothetical protein
VIYIAIEKSSGIIRGMSESVAELKEMVRDGKRRVSEYHYVPLSDRDYNFWCVGRAQEMKRSRVAIRQE